jgi:hypothetical protein
MNIGQYLLQLTAYAFIATIALFAGIHWRGGRGLLGVLAAEIVVVTGFYFTMRHRPGTVTPLASSIVAVAATAVVASILWRRRRSISVFQRSITVLASLLAFHLTWLAGGFALKDWY